MSMMVPFWLPPLIKALVTALLVVAASATAEAVGPFWGALVAALPVSAGPAYVFLALQHGAEFVSVSALSSFAGNAAVGVFLIVYGILARKSGPLTSLIAAVLAWLAVGLAVRMAMWTPVTATVLNVAVYGCGFVLLSTRRASAAKPPARSSSKRWRDLLMRAVAVAVFVSLVVGLSSYLGPDATGIAAVFPVSFISLLAIVRPRIGGLETSLLAANALRPMLGFGFGLLALHLAARPWGATMALVSGLLVSISWSAGLLMLRRRRAV